MVKTLEQKQAKSLYDKQYRDRNLEKKSEASRKWYLNNKEKMKEWYKKRYYKRKLEDPIGYLLNRVKIKATREKREFNLTREDIVIPAVCPILLIPIRLNDERMNKNSVSIDRVDNSKGYIKGNVKLISLRANAHKSDMSKEDIQRLYEYVNGA